ncbi:MAG: citrate synthase [Pirellulales bacterium]|nr:citrate synthase [Pirellulales bacterium]
MKAILKLPDGKIELPILVGSENERAIDITQLRSETGYITYDNGYGNTGSCRSEITYIDGEQGILRYRGYPIEELAEKSRFVEVAWLLISGELPTKPQLQSFSELLTRNAALHEGLRHHFEGFPPDAHPMAMLSAMINACSCYHPELLEMEDESHVLEGSAKLLSKVRTIAAFSYRKSIGRPIIHPHPKLSYTRNFLHMMFSQPFELYEAPDVVDRALTLLLTLHADHEQNCSTSTVRMVGSSGANLFASTAAGVCALWGPLHGGANLAVVNMLRKINESGIPLKEFIEKVKTDPNLRLMGFGHRVYKNYDPRAQILKKTADRLLNELGIQNPLLNIAKEIEGMVLEDDYFIERKLFPNVDFYSGIILSALNIPANMFTVIFAIGRMPGWIANWYEQFCQKAKIVRPRQIYTGYATRHYIPLDQR